MKAKGIPTFKLKKEMTFDKYKDTLFNNKKEEITFSSIRSNKHEIYTITQNKTGLSNRDDKRRWKNNTESYAYGHYRCYYEMFLVIKYRRKCIKIILPHLYKNICL